MTISLFLCERKLLFVGKDGRLLGSVMDTVKNKLRFRYKFKFVIALCILSNHLRQTNIKC